MLPRAENHTNTNSMGLQCVAQCCYEQNAQSETSLSLYKCVTNTQSCTQDKKQRFNAHCLDNPVLAQRGGGRTPKISTHPQSKKRGFGWFPGPLCTLKTQAQDKSNKHLTGGSARPRD